MQKKKSEIRKRTSAEPIYQFWAWILLAWSIYRYFARFPEWADELFFKPIVFALPVLWYVTQKEKRSIETLGLTTKKIFTSLYMGLGFGFVFALEGFFTNIIKYGTLTIRPIESFAQYGLTLILILSLATSISEELLCRGFLFTRIYEVKKSILTAAFISSVLFVLLHVPILVTSVKLTGITLVIFFVTDIILGFTNALLFSFTGSLVAPVLVHLFWNMTMAMFL